MKRGSNVALTREIPGLSTIVIGARFDPGPERAVSENLVLAAILCNAANKALTGAHFVFFNQLTSPDLSVAQLAEGLDSDDEQIEIDLHEVPAEVARIVVVVYLNDGIGPSRTLGRLRECTVRVVNQVGNLELVRSENLAPGLVSETGMALGEIYRHDGGWKFKVLGAGYENGILGIAADYGVHL
jgi:tellurium resistance protein TerD